MVDFALFPLHREKAVTLQDGKDFGNGSPGGDAGEFHDPLIPRKALSFLIDVIQEGEVHGDERRTLLPPGKTHKVEENPVGEF